jgi:thiazole synthase
LGTLEACRELVADGFDVLCYSSDDPIMAARLRDAGATSVMPAGSPIGSGRGIANPAAIRIILELLKNPAHGGSSDYPVIVDAGVGTPSDVTTAMELGADGVLLNTGIAHAADPVSMAKAMRLACDAGWLGHRSGRISKRLYATASSPWDGVISHIPGE